MLSVKESVEHRDVWFLYKYHLTLKMETAHQKQKHVVSLSSEVCFAHKDTSSGSQMSATIQNYDSRPLEGVKQTFKMAGISKPQIF